MIYQTYQRDKNRIWAESSTLFRDANLTTAIPHIGRPLRPSRSLILNTVKSVEVSYQSPNGGSFTKTIADVTDIVSLKAAFNARQLDRGVRLFGCSPDYDDWTISFKNPDGFIRKIHLGACDAASTGLEEENYTLYDGTKSMDRLLKAITGMKATAQP